MAETDAQQQPWPDRRYAWTVVAVLCLAYAVSFMDRQLLYLLVADVQRSLDATDTEISLLQGVAFGMFYTLLGLPLGRLADLRSRRAIIAVGIALWSVMTAACGLSRTYLQMFLARMGVGIGEASLSPSALSMISDYFPPQKRAAAVSTYVMGNTLGAGLALVTGGALIGAIGGWGDISLPGYGTLAPWQLTFLIAALPGLVLALVMMTIREPHRRGMKADISARPSPREVLAFVWQHRGIYLRHNIAMAMMSILTYGISAWAPTFFMRKFGWTASDVGARYGLVVLIFGCAGVLAGGVFAGYLSRRGHQDASLRATWIAIACLVPFGVTGPLMSDPTAALLMFIPVTAFCVMPFGTAATCLQEITPNQMRGQVAALYLFTISIVGTTIGATTVALLTDFVFADPLAVGKSMAVVAAVMAPTALAIMAPALRPFRDAAARAAAWS